MIPIVFGHPLWYGKIKNRVAKKHLYKSLIRHSKIFANYKIGDYVNDCTAWNNKITSIKPVYRAVGKGYVLSDIDLITTGTGCGLTSCGIEPPIAVDKLNQMMLEYYESWIINPESKKYYTNQEDCTKYFEKCKRIIETIKSGKFVTDEFGSLLPEFK